MDEVKIQEDLVYDKTGSNLLGFVNLGEVNDQLKQLEQEAGSQTESHKQLATHMLTLMVRGIFIKLNFPYASFPTQGKPLYNYFKLFLLSLLFRCHWWAKIG